RKRRPPSNSRNSSPRDNCSYWIRRRRLPSRAAARICILICPGRLSRCCGFAGSELAATGLSLPLTPTQPGLPLPRTPFRTTRPPNIPNPSNSLDKRYPAYVIQSPLQAFAVWGVLYVFTRKRPERAFIWDFIASVCRTAPRPFHPSFAASFRRYHEDVG